MRRAYLNQIHFAKRLMKFLLLSSAPLRALAVASALVLLAGCAPLVTQNPGGAISPANVVSLDGNDRVMLKGADVVAYFTDAQYKQGNPSIKSVYEKITFYFSNEENKRQFDAAPLKYVPQYGGYCANGTAYAIPWGGDADTWRVINGKLYIFGGAQSRDAFLLDPQKNVALADKYWNEEIKGANALFQRNKRLVMKVSHYKSDAEVAAEIAKQKK
jgi:YHS domain-containing protein